MSHIVIAGAVGVGHAIPTLETITELVDRGHQVTCVAVPVAVPALAATGAHVIAIDSVFATVDLAVMDTPEELDRLMVLGVEEDRRFIAAIEAYAEREGRPDLLVFDATRFAIGRILGPKWDVPTAAFCPVLVSNEHFSLQERVDAKRGVLPRRRPDAIRALRGVMSLLAEHGLGHLTLDDFFFRGQEGLYVAFYPREFQSAGETFDDRYAFVGPNLTEGTDPGGWRPPADGRRVVMVSLGTSVFRNPRLFRTCVDAFRDGDWQVVLHAPKGLDLAVDELPANVEVHSWLPQLAVLEHTDVLVCHGGPGTLMAAFAKETPVVVVPNSGEQMVNGDRAVELGLGTVIAQREITSAGLRAAVDELHADPGVRDRVKDMRAAIERAGGGTHGADAVEHYLKRHVDRSDRALGDGNGHG